MSVTLKPVPKMIASTSRSVAVAGDDRVLAHLGDAVGDELDVVAPERRIPLVRGQDPLAADRVAGLDLAPQLGVGDLAVHVLAGDPLDDLHQPRLLDEAEHEQLATRSRCRRGRAAAAAGSGGTGARSQREIGRSVWGMIHGAVRWKTCICSTSGAIAGTNWIAEAPVPITATRLPVDVVVVVPLRGVEHAALEAVQALDVGRLGIAQRAGGGDQHAGAERRRASVSTRPALLVLVPVGAGDRRAEADVSARRRSPRRRAAGRPRSRAAWSRCASSPGWARTRRSRGATGRRSRSPDTC